MGNGTGSVKRRGERCPGFVRAAGKKSWGQSKVPEYTSGQHSAPADPMPRERFRKFGTVQTADFQFRLLKLLFANTQ